MHTNKKETNKRVKRGLLVGALPIFILDCMRHFVVNLYSVPDGNGRDAQ